MTYSTLMVHLEIGRANAGLLRVAGDLAETFHAGVIGIAASQPLQAVFGGSYACADVVQSDGREVEEEIAIAEAEFRAALHGRGGVLEWRSAVMFSPLKTYFAAEARAADLVISGVASAGLMNDTRRVNTDELLIQAGRPMLIVPDSVSALKLDRVLLAWKDTRETRRAAIDAIPLLQKAAAVVVVEIAGETEMTAARGRVGDVAAWLKRHGVVAEPVVARSHGDDAWNLNAIATAQGAGVIVAGAYGHSRLREFVWGGVTRDLLFGANRCALLSH